MSASDYWRTCDEDGRTRTHLSNGGDHSICGHDLVGDPMTHSKEPVELPEHPKPRVTCEHCQEIIAVVKRHLGKE